eukprot:519283_1
MTISLKEGWHRIYVLAVQPFFERVENVDFGVKFERVPINAISKQQYILAYDTIFTMCRQGQRGSYNYSTLLYQKHSESLMKQYKEKFATPLRKDK